MHFELPRIAKVIFEARTDQFQYNTFLDAFSGDLFSGIRLRLLWKRGAAWYLGLQRHFQSKVIQGWMFRPSGIAATLQHLIKQMPSASHAN